MPARPSRKGGRGKTKGRHLRIGEGSKRGKGSAVGTVASREKKINRRNRNTTATELDYSSSPNQFELAGKGKKLTKLQESKSREGPRPWRAQ